jgi:hypothetical protein
VEVDVRNQGRKLQRVTQQLRIPNTRVERRVFSCGK